MPDQPIRSAAGQANGPSTGRSRSGGRSAGSSPACRPRGVEDLGRHATARSAREDELGAERDRRAGDDEVERAAGGSPSSRRPTPGSAPARRRGRRPASDQGTRRKQPGEQAPRRRPRRPRRRRRPGGVPTARASSASSPQPSAQAASPPPRRRRVGATSRSDEPERPDEAAEAHEVGVHPTVTVALRGVTRGGDVQAGRCRASAARAGASVCERLGAAAAVEEPADVLRVGEDEDREAAVAARPRCSSGRARCSGS